jgi:hypothetical protein
VEDVWGEEAGGHFCCGVEVFVVEDEGARFGRSRLRSIWCWLLGDCWYLAAWELMFEPRRFVSCGGSLLALSSQWLATCMMSPKFVQGHKMRDVHGLGSYAPGYNGTSSYLSNVPFTCQRCCDVIIYLHRAQLVALISFSYVNALSSLLFVENLVFFTKCERPAVGTPLSLPLGLTSWRDCPIADTISTYCWKLERRR